MSRKQVLIVEDDAMNMMLLSETLRSDNLSVQCAYSGEEGVELFRKDRYDLVLMDIQLPGINGTEAMKILNRINDRVPVIALTGYGRKGDREKFLTEGFSAYMSKPFEIDTLKEKIMMLFRD